jgi:hypothetical protein
MHKRLGDSTVRATSRLIQVPDAFCWTRFGPEAGQSSNDILVRKDHERAAQEGLFLWGIGNALGPSIRQLIETNASPRVLFSPIKSHPRPEDVRPASVVAWTKAQALDGTEFDLPPRCLVLSRQDAAGQKQVHYALVCYSATSLMRTQPVGQLYFEALRNILTGSPVGASQVTAVVRREPCQLEHGRSYEIALAAHLVRPYFLRLRDPVAIVDPTNLNSRCLGRTLREVVGPRAS